MTDKPPQSPQDNLNALRVQVESIMTQQPELAKWLKAIQEEQQTQTKLLRNINTVANLIGILVILSLLAACCLAMNGLGTISRF